VLPFTDDGVEIAREFSDGLTDETMLQLGRLEGRGVDIVARSSSFAFRGGACLARDIGATLRADYLLEGSVRRQGERARIAENLRFCEAGATAPALPAVSRHEPSGRHAKYLGLKQWGWYIDQMPLWKLHLATGDAVRVLEIGAFDGVSANMMLDEIFTHPQTQLVAIDPYLPDSTTPEVSSGTRETFRRNVEIGGHRTQVKLLQSRVLLESLMKATGVGGTPPPRRSELIGGPGS